MGRHGASVAPGWRYAPQLKWTMAKLYGSQNSSVPPEWAQLVSQQHTYRFSSIAVGLSGCFMLALSPWARANVAAHWPWELFGAIWLVQGFGSWMADVENLGRTSRWHALDTQLALLNISLLVVYGVSLMVGGVFGFVAFRFGLRHVALNLYLIGIAAAALFCKAQSGAAITARLSQAYFFWHASWHYVITLGLCTSLCLGVLPS